MELILVWFVFAIVVGVIAGSRGRSGFGWFLLSLIITPLLGVILVLALGAPKSDPARDGEHKKCPACAEWVKREALKCKHCGELLAATVDRPVASEVARPSPGAQAFGRGLGAFVARNKRGLMLLAVLVVFWLVFRRSVVGP